MGFNLNINRDKIERIFYDSGDVFLPKPVKKILDTTILGSKTQTFWYIDGWTIMHFISGILFGYLYLKLEYDIDKYYFKMFVLHTIWELWQTLVGMTEPTQLFGLNSLFDTIVDTFVFMIGTYIIRQIV